MTTQPDLDELWRWLCKHPKLRAMLTAPCVKCGAAYGHKPDRQCCGPLPHGQVVDDGCHGSGRQRKPYSWPLLDVAMLKAAWEPYLRCDADGAVVGYLRLQSPFVGDSEEIIVDPTDPDSRTLAQLQAAMRALKARKVSDAK